MALPISCEPPNADALTIKSGFFEKRHNFETISKYEDCMTREQVFEFIKKRKTAIVSSVDGEGFPNTKAMLSPRKIDGNDFYFTTNTSSMRVAQYNANGKACIYFYKRGLFSYVGVMLVGSMQVLTEQGIKDEIWRRGDQMFYKGGKTDPDYCILKFTALKCRFYKDLKTVWIDL